MLIVPARSGSKGLVDKNIKILGGRPLLSWTIQAVQQANPQNGLTVLSTDSEQYRLVGQELGMAAPFLRPKELATDTTSAIDVALHALRWFEAEFNYLPESIMWLQPTSPFRSPVSIEQAFELMKTRQANAVIGCKEIHRDLSTLFRCEKGYLSALDREKTIQTARQQIEPLLTPNGAIYLCKTASFLECKSFYPDKTLPMVMNTVQSLDIDTEVDWAMAEAFIQQGLV